MSVTTGGINSVLDDARINGRSAFFEGLGSGIDGSWASRVGMEIDSTTEVERYNWLGFSQGLSEWEGEATVQQLGNYAHTLTNIDYQDGMLIRKADLRRDKTGQIRNSMSNFGLSQGDHWESLVSTLLLNGEATTNGAAYDSQAFFDTDHDESGSDQTNDLTATEVPSANVATTTKLTATEAAGVIFETISHMWTLKNDKGNPINNNARNWVVMCGTSTLFAGLIQAVGLESLTSGATNPIRALRSEMGVSVTPILNPRLSASTTKLYFMCTDGIVKPFILQSEVPLDVFEDFGRDGFDKDVKISATATRAAGYGLWQRAALVTLS